MSRHPYVRPISKTTWYMRNGRYKRYMLREVTCLLVGLVQLPDHFGAGGPGARPNRWNAFIASQQSPAWPIFHGRSADLFPVFLTFDWFKLAPKAMPIQMGGKKLPDQVHHHRTLRGLGRCQRLHSSGWRECSDGHSKKSDLFGDCSPQAEPSAFVFPAY